MNAPTVEQDEQCQTTRLNIDFSHRLSWLAIQGRELNAYGVNQCITEMADRAEAILNMLQYQFTGTEDCRPDDSIIYSVVESVIKEIQDIRSVVGALSHAEYEKQSGIKKPT